MLFLGSYFRCKTASRCHSRDESEKSLHIGDITHKQGIHPGFKSQGRHHQKSKTRVSVTPQKGLIYSKNSEKEKRKKKVAVSPCIERISFATGDGLTGLFPDLLVLPVTEYIVKKGKY